MRGRSGEGDIEWKVAQSEGSASRVAARQGKAYMASVRMDKRRTSSTTGGAVPIRQLLRRHRDRWRGMPSGPLARRRGRLPMQCAPEPRVQVANRDRRYTGRRLARRSRPRTGRGTRRATTYSRVSLISVKTDAYARGLLINADDVDDVGWPRRLGCASELDAPVRRSPLQLWILTLTSAARWGVDPSANFLFRAAWCALLFGEASLSSRFVKLAARSRPGYQCCPPSAALMVEVQ